MNKLLLAVFHRDKGRGVAEKWTFAPRPIDESFPFHSTGPWDTTADATQAAIAYARSQGVAMADLSIMGHADRDAIQANGAHYVDSRGNKRRGKRSSVMRVLKRILKRGYITQRQFDSAVSGIATLQSDDPAKLIDELRQRWP